MGPQDRKSRDLFKKSARDDPHAKASDAAIEWAFGILSTLLGICLGVLIMPSPIVFIVICMACSFIGLFLGVQVVGLLRKRRARQ